MLSCSKPASARNCIPAHPCKRCTPALAGFVCAAVLSTAGARQQSASAAGCLLCSKSGSTSNSIQLSITKRCTPPFGLHLRSNAFVQQRNSPHSLPVALVQQVCSCICRFLLPGAALRPAGSTCTALPHRQTPEHSHQSAFAPSCTASFCRRLTIASRIVFAAQYAFMTKTAEATRTA